VKASQARHLASARLEVVADQRAKRTLRLIVVAAILCLAAVEGMRLLHDGTSAAGQRGSLESANAALRAQVAGLQAELQLERATRAAVDRQAAELGRQVAELERQLAFVNAQKTRTQAGAGTN
jgi:hypothetical protein